MDTADSEIENKQRKLRVTPILDWTWTPNSMSYGIYKFCRKKYRWEILNENVGIWNKWRMDEVHIIGIYHRNRWNWLVLKVHGECSVYFRASCYIRVITYSPKYPQRCFPIRLTTKLAAEEATACSAYKAICFNRIHWFPCKVRSLARNIWFFIWKSLLNCLCNADDSIQRKIFCFLIQNCLIPLETAQILQLVPF